MKMKTQEKRKLCIYTEKNMVYNHQKKSEIRVVNKVHLLINVERSPWNIRFLGGNGLERS